jgi:SAM-dependent methyltransferase
VSFAFEAAFFRTLISDRRPARVLVVGCGAGVEVGHLAEALGAPVIGVDLDVDPAWRRPGVALVRADARALPFRPGAFEALYCYHVLEHVPQPGRAVAEARRVLRDGAPAYFGTPNKSRLVGYAGGRASLGEKLRWNAVDWSRRLTGRWSNEQGAHAGFTHGELLRLLATAFARVEPVSLPYYLGKYPALGGLWRTSFRLGLARFLMPSVYFLARAGAGFGPSTEE